MKNSKTSTSKQLTYGDNLKIAIICSDFRKSNLKKLPWKYVHEIAKYLSKSHEVLVITDTDKNDVNKLKTVYIKKLFDPFKGETNELLEILNHENPDKCIMLLGLTSFLRKEFKINKPVIGIFTSPIYSFRELIRNIGIKDSIKYRNYTIIHYINSLIPSFFVKKWSPYFDKIVFLSNYTQKELIKRGLDEKKSALIPLGLDDVFLKSPDSEKVEKLKNEINHEKLPVIMYFTSPLTLRGTDTLVKAFSRVRKKIPCKLILLSRMDYTKLSDEVNILKNLAKKEDISHSMKIISKYLSSEEIKEYLSVADVVCLPFKIVISDVPVSLLEVMALGKPVISSDVGCIPEILNERGIIIKANNHLDLANAINKIIDDKNSKNCLIDNSHNYIEKYPNWNLVGGEFNKILESEFNESVNMHYRS